MIGVFEAGGTKTEFIFGDSNRQNQAQASGIHPMFMSGPEIRNVLEDLLSRSGEYEPGQIWFYGASCGSHEMSGRVEEVLQSLFPGKEIRVESDLLGTARALCGKEPGFASILGTGSNACLFDGQSISSRMVSFGFWLGDEGSGGYIGKMVFRSWLKGQLPKEFETEAETLIGCPAALALQLVSSSVSPNALVAKLAGMAIRNRSIPIFRSIIEHSINDFFNENEALIQQAGNVPFHFSGSVAYHLQNEIKEILKRKGLNAGVFADRTTERLFNYHLSLS